MISGGLLTQLVHVAAELRLADLLADGAKSSDELARMAGVHPRALYRVLRALAGLGVFAETSDGRFELTPLALPLQDGAPDSLRSLAIIWGTALWPAYGELAHSVRTGAVAFEHVHGMGLFDYLQRHPAAGEIFNEAMTNFTRPHAAAVVAAYDFAGTSTLVDIGGGNGSLIAAILAAHPQMRGILFEQRDVLDRARGTLEREGVLSRCTLVEGDFFQAVPEGADAYILKDIIHDWEDERAVVILQHCRQAMRADGKLLLVERAVPAGNASAAGKLIDITMLSVTGGCERTEREYRDLLARVGLKLTRVVPTASEMVVVEAVPV
jgi:precorrin-6B methylase 2